MAEPSPTEQAAPRADALTGQVDRLIADLITGGSRAGRDLASGFDTELVADLEAVRRRLNEPLRVAIAGRVKAGKSTLLNALIGEQLAPTDAGECTKIVTWYQHGPTYRVTVEHHDGTTHPARFSRQSGTLHIDIDDIPAEAIKRLVVEWPSKRLADLTLIDTPGVASLNTVVSERAVAFLTPEDDRPVEADAVLYLMRHMHADDLSFLESFHDDELAHASPVNALGLLSRADEIGVGRPNAMRVAERIAGRYRGDPRLRRLCQTVLPIAGLVAETAATLTQEEFEALSQLAQLDRADVEKLMLSADRFRAEDARVGDRTCPVPALVRTHLLDRLGLYGIRVSLPLIRQGRTESAGALAETLAKRSGITDLRRELLERFTQRSDVLRARSALLAVARLAGRVPVELQPELLQEIERVRSGAHAFAEIRLLNDHRRGAIAFPGKTAAEAGQELERLLGAEGTSAEARLGLPAGAEADAVRSSLLDTIDRWRRRGEHPLASPEVAAAASVLVRTCEGALATTVPSTDR